jgi:hypothetical protein
VEKTAQRRASSNIISEINLRRLRWAGHVACIEYTRNSYTIVVGKLEEKEKHDSE